MRVLVGSLKSKLLVVLFLCSNVVFAANLGVIGRVYPIKETDLFVLIQQRLKKMQATGKIAQVNQAFRSRSLAYVKQPPAVAGIKHTTVAKHHFVDPSVVLSHNVYGQNHRLLAKAGTKINPLHTIAFKEMLLFIDGTAKNQLHWAISQAKKWQGPVKIILVKGPVIQLMKQTHRRLYFDQYGVLTHHFHITQVPAKVYQKGEQLEVDEVKL